MAEAAALQRTAMAEAAVPLQTRDEDVVAEAVVLLSTRTRWRRLPSLRGHYGGGRRPEADDDGEDRGSPADEG